MCHHLLGIFKYWFQNECLDQFETYGFHWNFTADIYWKYFGLTLLFEAPIYYLLLRKQLAAKKIVWAILLLNLLTHPLVFFVFPRFADEFGFTYGNYVLIAELFAPLVEGLALSVVFKIPARKAFIAAIAANLFSWLIGGEVLQLFW